MSPMSGDIFEVPLSDGRFAYGVAIMGGGTPYIIVLRTPHLERPDLAALDQDEIALVGRTMDALIHHGRWPIVGANYPARCDIPFPNWKVSIEGKLLVTDFSGKPLRVAKEQEARLLDFRFSRAPIAFQSAIEALHGLQEWREDYDKLTPAYVRARVL